MDRRLAESLLSVRHVVCGRRLQPFCYLHFAALEAVENPVVIDGGKVSPEELLYAVRVCAMRAHDVEYGVPEIKRSWRDTVHLFLMYLSSAYYRKCMQGMVDYIEDYAALPMQEQPTDTKPNTFNVPALFGRLCSVMIRYKGAISEDRARSMPIGLLIWYDEVGAYLLGGGRPFVDEEWEATIERGLEEADRRGEELMRQWQA